MSERSLMTFEHYREASQRFDYFITGLSGALCAYIAQTFQPEKIAVSPKTLELIALLLLIGSVIAGFKRIEAIIQTHKLNHQKLDLTEKTGAILTNFNGQPMVNILSGDVLQPDQAETTVLLLKSQIPIIENSLDKWVGLSGTAYSIRNWMLILGFLSLVVAKVWSAYY